MQILASDSEHLTHPRPQATHDVMLLAAVERENPLMQLKQVAGVPNEQVAQLGGQR